MIYVEAASLLCALGSSRAQILSNLAQGLSPGMQADLRWLVSSEPVPLGHVASAGLPPLSSTRNNQILEAAFRDPQADFAHRLSRFDPARIAVVIGTSTSGSDEADQFVRGDLPGFDAGLQEMGNPALFLAELSGARGPAYAVSTACTSSTRAIASAARLLEAGLADAVLAGGADTLARMPINGFNSLGALSHTSCRPFAADRDGIAIGEAAALMLLTRQPSAVRLAGWGESSDAHHMTAPNPQGRGAASAMRSALGMANLAPEKIGYVNLHGTGTHLNDAAEALAMQAVFGQPVPCSSTKNLMGHTLGAAGAAEAVLSAWIAEGPAVLPGQFSTGGAVDPQLPEIGLLREKAALDASSVLTANYAFGGSNAALVFTRT